jgi:hypothetical protein
MGSSTRAGAGWADGRMNGTEKLQLILNCMHVRISHLASRPHPRWQWRAWVPTGNGTVTLLFSSGAARPAMASSSP